MQDLPGRCSCVSRSNQSMSLYTSALFDGFLFAVVLKGNQNQSHLADLGRFSRQKLTTFENSRTPHR